VEYAKKMHKKISPGIEHIIQQITDQRNAINLKEEPSLIDILETIYVWRPKDSQAQSFRFRCPNCTRKLQLPASKVGKNIRCPNCQQRLIAKYKD